MIEVLIYFNLGTLKKDNFFKDKFSENTVTKGRYPKSTEIFVFFSLYFDRLEHIYKSEIVLTSYFIRNEDLTRIFFAIQFLLQF